MADCLTGCVVKGIYFVQSSPNLTTAMTGDDGWIVRCRHAENWADLPAVSPAPAPPGNALQAGGDSGRKPHPQWPGRDTVHHAVGRDVFRHHRARCQHRTITITITKGDGGQHNHAVTDPDIISSHHPIGAAGSQEVLFAPRLAMVLLRAGGKAML